jgi:hypothetical protein
VSPKAPIQEVESAIQLPEVAFQVSPKAAFQVSPKAAFQVSPKAAFQATQVPPAALQDSQAAFQIPMASVRQLAVPAESPAFQPPKFQVLAALQDLRAALRRPMVMTLRVPKRPAAPVESPQSSAHTTA